MNADSATISGNKPVTQFETKRTNAMDAATVIAALRRHWEYAGKDEDISHEIYHDDAVLEFPQSQERYVGKENFITWRKKYPANVQFKIRRAIC